MSVKIGEVETFTDVKPDKAQALKVLEESAEVFGAWQDWHLRDPETFLYAQKRRALFDECADVIQATCNLLAALEMDDFTEVMKQCKRRNEKRGRL